MKFSDLPTLASIYARVEDGGCWIRLGGATGSGRPAMKIVGEVVYVARVALALKSGRLLRRGMLAGHTCDTPMCVNPDHLEEVSYSRNLFDAYGRGRRGPKTLIEAVQ